MPGWWPRRNRDLLAFILVAAAAASNPAVAAARPLDPWRRSSNGSGAIAATPGVPPASAIATDSEGRIVVAGPFDGVSQGRPAATRRPEPSTRPSAAATESQWWTAPALWTAV